jgi:hypothetical protein
VPTATVLVIPATHRLIVLKVAGATTMAFASGTLSGSSGSRHRWRTGKPVMASSSGASMNATASGVAVTATSQPAACASFYRARAHAMVALAQSWRPTEVLQKRRRRRAAPGSHLTDIAVVCVPAGRPVPG